MSIKPYFWKQTDKRWRYKSVGSMTLGAGGCGPTAIANIVSPLLQKNITPAKVWDYMKKHGYLIPGAGSTWDGITKTLKHYGIKFKVAYSDAEVRECLKKRMWLVALAGPSRWTSSGHYFDIYKLTSSGKIYVSDPYSSSDYCQKDGTLAEYLRANKCNWIFIDPSDYPGGKAVKPKKKKATKTEIMYVDTAAANIRKGPGMRYGVKAVVKRATKLKVAGNDDGWYKIKSGKYKGLYIAGSVLTAFEPYKHQYKALFKMNVRKGAGASTAVKGALKKGTKITSTKRSGDWLYFPAVKGWIRRVSGDGKTEYMKKLK